MTHVPWLGFLLASGAVLAVPGPDLALLTQQTIASGTAVAYRSALGILTGGAVHAVAASTGVTVLLLAQPRAASAIHLAGACYLLYLGAKILAGVRADRRLAAAGPAAHRTPRGNGRPYVLGFATNLLNPKAALFFAAFLPAFAPASDRTAWLAILAGCYLALALVWLLGYVHILGRLRDRRRTRSPAPGPGRSTAMRHAAQACAGIVLAGTGASLLLP